MTKWKVFILAAALAPLLAACGKPQAVRDLKDSITALRVAGNEAAIGQDKYHALVVEALGRLTAAKAQLPGDAAQACDEALARAADVDLFWHDTDGIADGLTPVAQEPLTRLGVVKSDAEFRKAQANFIPLQRSVDGEGAADTPQIVQNRNDLRHDLVKRAMAAAGPALKKAEEAL